MSERTIENQEAASIPVGPGADAVGRPGSGEVDPLEGEPKMTGFGQNDFSLVDFSNKQLPGVRRDKEPVHDRPDLFPMPDPRRQVAWWTGRAESDYDERLQPKRRGP